MRRPLSGQTAEVLNAFFDALLCLGSLDARDQAFLIFFLELVCFILQTLFLFCPTLLSFVEFLLEGDAILKVEVGLQEQRVGLDVCHVADTYFGFRSGVGVGGFIRLVAVVATRCQQGCRDGCNKSLFHDVYLLFSRL